MKTAKLVSLVVLGGVLSACASTLPPELALPHDLQVSALIGQTRQGTLEVTNAGGSPLSYALGEAADWLVFTGESKGRLEPGATADLGFVAQCPERADTLQTALTLTSDDPDRASATTQVTLVCADALRPGEEGFVAALGAWNWSESDEGALGSALLLGFRYLQPGTVTVSVNGPPGWNGDATRHLILPGPTFPNSQPSEDVWTYDLLTHGETALAGIYRVTATTNRGDSYTVDLELDSSRFIHTPKNITVTPLGDGVSVAWTPVAGAKAYYAVVTDPSDGIVPQQVANSAAPGLSVLTTASYARAFTKTTSLELAASLTPDRPYQVTVVAFTSALVLGHSEAETLAVKAAASFDTSSASKQFIYKP